MSKSKQITSQKRKTYKIVSLHERDAYYKEKILNKHVFLISGSFDILENGYYTGWIKFKHPPKIKDNSTLPNTYFYAVKLKKIS